MLNKKALTLVGANIIYALFAGIIRIRYYGYNLRVLNHPMHKQLRVNFPIPCQ